MCVPSETLKREAQRERLHVAIDGPAGAGKSTLGRALAGVLGCAFLDTGLMYRAVTWLAQRQGVSPQDEAGLTGLAVGAQFALPSDRANGIEVDGRNMDAELRTPGVDREVSAVSAHPALRTVLVERQRELARDRCIVMAGRDIGTVVLPEAPVKLWVTAPPEVRAQRRGAEGLGQGSESQVRAEIESRDTYDSGRQVSPLRRAGDAVAIETGRLSEEEALEAALAVVGAALRSRAVPIPVSAEPKE